MIAVIPKAHAANRMTDIFISYSRHDQAWVAKLAKALEDVGYSVWWDTQLLAGDDFHHTIPAVLEEARCAIVVWSKVSVERQWVRAEAYRANERKVLVPVRIDQTRIPLPFNLLQAEDMQRWNGRKENEAFQRLLKALARHCPLSMSHNVTELEPESKTDISPPRQSHTRWWLVGIVVMVVAGGSYAYLKDNPSPQGRISKSSVSAAPVTTQPEQASKPESLPEPKSTEEEVAPKSLPASTPVSSSSADELITGRYIDNGNGTITDTQTKLMWKKCSEGQNGTLCSGKAAEYKWDDAMERFKGGASFAGYNDWRMPTKDELKSLVYCSNGKKTPLPDYEACGEDGTYQRPTINQHALPSVAEDAWFWSASPYAGNSYYAWGVGFGYGGDGTGVKGYGGQVRLVRSGQ